tara:strand:- start:340 stop:513 length:174 start_codon:yes stop_codon:yes gene_type:complete
LLAGVRLNHDFGLPSGGFKPEGFIQLNSKIGENVRAFAEATATAERLAAVAGLKISW